MRLALVSGFQGFRVSGFHGSGFQSRIFFEEEQMPNYYRVRLGRDHRCAKECFAQSFIGVNFSIAEDLTAQLSDIATFKATFIPIWMANCPDRSKVAASIACGQLWTVSKGIHVGDQVLCPDGEGHYHIGEVTGEYFFNSSSELIHRRPVRWINRLVVKACMSKTLEKSAGTPVTVRDLSAHSDEILKLSHAEVLNCGA